MATGVTQIPQQSASYDAKSNPKSIKELAESPNLTSIPSNYAYFSDQQSSAVDPDDHHLHDCAIPVIDFSVLESGSPDQRSRVIHDLGKTCQDWGFFMVLNHGVPESLIKLMIDKVNEFLNLTVEEKQEYEGKHVLDPIRYGTSFNTSIEKVHFWRDYLKITVHPQFHSPTKPHDFSKIASEYCKQARRVALVLLRGISTSLGLDGTELERSMDLEMGLNILTSNYYPRCPQPDIAIGMPPHSDHGLLTLVAQDIGGGLQVLHDGKWVLVNALPNSFLVNTSDQLEIFSNGRYKSNQHRAVVNMKAARTSVVITHGPSLNTVVAPAPQLLNGEAQEPAKYKPMSYKDYLYLQQTRRLDGKSCLDIVRV